MSSPDLVALTGAVLDLDDREARRQADEALTGGASPLAVLDAARAAMEEVGVRFERGEAFLPELVAAGDIMTGVAAIVSPRLEAEAQGSRTLAVLGTVRGDIHDIGKNIVATLLRAAGLEVIDLGVDVPPERFAAAVAESGADIVGLSCLLTVGFASMKETVAALRAAALGGDLRVMIGGGAVDESVCRYVGADGWGADAPAAVKLAGAWAAAGDERGARGDATATGERAVAAAPRITSSDACGVASPEEPGTAVRPPQTPDERFASRFEAWEQAEHLEFTGPEAAARYKRHCRWLRDTIELRGTVVPVGGSFLHYPYRRQGIPVRTAMYDYDILAHALLEFHTEHLPDVISVDPLLPGRVFDLLDCRQWAWPGHGVDDDGAFQWVEGAYMEADEYGLLLDDPTRFWLTRYLPRVFPVLAPLSELPPLTDIDSAAVTGVLGALATDEAGAMFEALREGAAASVAFDEGWAAAYDAVSATLGLPAWFGGATYAPYDCLANELRGARNTMLDIVYRRDLVKAAVDRLTPLSIDKAVRAVDTFGIPIILVPLHWGSDGFMSDADYRELYWPPLEALIRGCVDEGVVPLLWTEADYSSRLPVIAEAQLPPGRTLWGFEDTPMKLARDMIGDRCAITGNFPVSLLEVGDEAEVRATVLRLFDDAAGDGNFIFNLGASADEGRPENVHAMFDEAKRLSGRDDAG